MKRIRHPDHPRSGVTVGWLLGGIALLAVVVIIVLLVWRPGATPTPDPAEAPPPAEEEAPAVADEEPAAPGADAAPEGRVGEEPPADDRAAEEPAEESPAEGAAGEAPAEQAAAPEEETEEVDASVETEEGPALRTDPLQRTAEVGGVLAEAAERTSAAIRDTEARLEGLERSTPGAEETAAGIDVPSPSAPSENRVRSVEPAFAPTLDRSRSFAGAASEASRTERTPSSPSIRLDAPEASAGTSAESPRVRTVELGDRTPAAVGDVRTRSGAAQRSRTSESGEARIELDGAGDAPQGDEVRARSVSPDVGALREAVERLQQSARSSLDVRTASPSEQSP